MDIKDLHNLFPLQLPIKDWNGKPDKWSNLIDWRLKMTQRFAENKLDYSQFNLKGHNGIDIAFITGCPIVAPCDLWITFTRNVVSEGYGKCVFGETETRTRNGDSAKLEMVFGHLDEVVAKPYTWVKEGELIGAGGNTGFSTGPHLHFGIRPLLRLTNGSFKQLFQDNGYLGYIDPEPFMPKIYWDWQELINMDKYDKKLLFNSKTGEIGWFYDKYLRTAKTEDRFSLMLGSYIHRNFGGITIDDNEWKRLPKKDF